MTTLAALSVGSQRLPSLRDVPTASPEFSDVKPTKVADQLLATTLVEINGIQAIGEEEEDDTQDAEVGEEEEFPQQQSTRQRTHRAKFATWINEQAEILDEAEEKPLRPEDVDITSLRDLMARQQTHVIGNPRDYQMELFERAKIQNTIAVLDTGSGKTLIAVLLLRYVADQELEDRANGKPHRISFFLVDKVTLVFQQFAVLEANLGYKAERFCGAMGCDLWTKEVWAEHFKENMVIVCTADVLAQCLMHSFITIEQINLLVFDEAHHAKKGHAYARIIKDFYLHQSQGDRRPRIFGMTASPIDVRVRDDVVEKAKELEALLDCQIATTSDLALLRATVSRPAEQVLVHTRLSKPFVTVLHRELRSRFSDVPAFRRLFDHAEAISVQLGRWCSDAYWSFAFSNREAKKYEARAERRHMKTKSPEPIEMTDREVTLLRQAQSVVEGYVLGKPALTLEDLSSKVLKLHEYLQLYYETLTDTRCLVFVERKSTASLLKLVFDRIGWPNLKTGILVGSNARNTDGLQTSFKQQVTTLVKFRSGELNCLFATSVAEEGLDIQDCNIVIRFDLCKTMIQYIQSRGRARHKNSKFVHLIEQGSTVQEDNLRSMNKSEKVMRQFCEQLPQDRLLDKSESLEIALVKERAFRSYTDKLTGAKLTYDFALVVLAHFASALPHGDEDDMTITYIVSAQGGKFICEVILPARSPVRSAIGREYARKSSARRSAAWEACMKLRKGHYLDGNLLPIYIKKVPAMRNAQLALNSKNLTTYPMQLKPKLWLEGQGSSPEELFLTVIHLADCWDRPVKPLGILSRDRLPSCPSFPIYRLSGQDCGVLSVSIFRSMSVDNSMINKLTSFTLRFFLDLFNKDFERDEKQMPYWLVPLTHLPDGLDVHYGQPFSLIDQEALRATEDSQPLRWTKNMPDEHLIDKFLVDPWHGGKRYFTEAVAEDLRPSDKVPKELQGDVQTESTILESSLSLFKNSQGRRSAWDMEQPVLFSKRLMHRLNVLATPTKQEAGAQLGCVVCPEPLHISPLSSAVVTMGYLLPAIIHRLECYWTSLEMVQIVGLSKIGPALALEALTKDADNTDESQEQQINFQRGMGPNYERLEFIGDCFLKMATTISLFSQFIGQNEDEMHVYRMCMICNKNMYQHAKKAGYYRYIRSLCFSRRTWYPPGLKLLKGKGAGKTQDEVTHALADKTIADICEALIGAALLSHYQSGYDNPRQFDAAVHAVAHFVRSDHHTMQKWSDYRETYSPPESWFKPPTASQTEFVKSINEHDDYHFKSPLILRSAFLHPSYPRSWEGIPSYQRLEFLGDSLLDMACVMHLVENYTQRDPQWLTEHKMAMVSNKFLGAVCVRIGFHKYLRHNSHSITHQIMTFVDAIQVAEAEAKGARDYWTNVSDPPKCLPDIVEAYIGALFIDSGFQYSQVQRFFDRHIKWFFADMSIYDTFARNHPTTRLHEFLSVSMGCHNYRLMSGDIPGADGISTKIIASVSVHGTMVGQGKAASSKIAKVIASSTAYKEMQGLAPWEFRLKYACDCKPEDAKHSIEGLHEMIGTAI